MIEPSGNFFDSGTGNRRHVAALAGGTFVGRRVRVEVLERVDRLRIGGEGRPDAARALRSRTFASIALTAASSATPAPTICRFSRSIASTSRQAVSSSRVRYSLRGSDSECP